MFIYFFFMYTYTYSRSLLKIIFLFMGQSKCFFIFLLCLKRRIYQERIFWGNNNYAIILNVCYADGRLYNQYSYETHYGWLPYTMCKIIIKYFNKLFLCLGFVHNIWWCSTNIIFFIMINETPMTFQSINMFKFFREFIN